MKSKILSLFLMTAILSLALVSAATADLISTNNPVEFTKSKLTTSFDITNIAEEANVTLDITSEDIILEDDDGNKITVSVNTSAIEVLEDGAVTIEATITIDEDFNFKDINFGEHLISTITITADFEEETEIETVKLYFINGFCEFGEIGELEIIEVEDKELDNEDAWIWLPLENIRFDVEIYNGFEDTEKIRIEYEIFDDTGRKEDFGNEDNEQSISIKSDRDEKVTFDLKVPADIDEGEYKLFIKAYVRGHEDDEGCIDNTDSDYLNQGFYQTISITKDEDRAIVVDMDKIVIPESAESGETISVSAKVWNIGIEDEDYVLVNLYNKELGININEVVKDIENGESKTVNFDFKIPQNTESDTYFFRLITFYEFDDDEDDTESSANYLSNSKDDLEDDFDFSLNVEGKVQIAEPVITATLDSETPEAIPGEQVIIKATITNTGDSETTYDLSVTGNSAWSSLISVNPQSITLDAGESEDIEIILTIDEDAEGDKDFAIKATYDDQITEQRVALAIQEKQDVGADKIVEHLKTNWFIYAIVIVNLILIIAIISVVKRMVGTPASAI